jgi:predicted Rossmann fold flavoprotein
VSGPRIAVVGAGAAGLTAALRAAEAGARVTLLNAHPRIGLKILMSGGTRCNVTHAEVTERDYHGGSSNVVARVLRAFPPEATRAWFESLGVALKLEPTGKYFPVTDDAQTVLDALLGAVTRAGVAVESGARAVRLERAPSDGGEGFRIGIQTVRTSSAFGVGTVAAFHAHEWSVPPVVPDRWIEARHVILASGGLSFPRTGSDGTGYALAAALGHTIVPPIPALTPLAADDPLCRSCQGTTLDAELTLRADGRREVTGRGSFLFTHFGYSGPAALDLSRHWLRAEGAGERRVTASFLPGETAESLAAAWVSAAAAEPRLTVRRYLGARLPDRLVVELCGEAGVEPAALVGQVGRAARARLIERAIARLLPVSGTLGYEKAEVTAGGVTLAEVNPSTLESRVCAGLYLCGEILDVEGRLGGFNFQWAWSSGTVAGRSAAPS